MDALCFQLYPSLCGAAIKCSLKKIPGFGGGYRRISRMYVARNVPSCGLLRLGERAMTAVDFFFLLPRQRVVTLREIPSFRVCLGALGPTVISLLANSTIAIALLHTFYLISIFQLLGKLWSQVSPLLPTGRYMPYFLSRGSFRISTVLDFRRMQ